VSRGLWDFYTSGNVEIDTAAAYTRFCQAGSLSGLRLNICRTKNLCVVAFNLKPRRVRLRLSNFFKEKHLPYCFAENHFAKPPARKTRAGRKGAFITLDLHGRSAQIKLLGGRPGPSCRVPRLDCSDLRQSSTEAH
jgi:hypothetical protein